MGSTLALFKSVELVLLISSVAPKLAGGISSAAFTASLIESGRTIGFKGAEFVIVVLGFSSDGF
jgi:hypothetical protein